MALDLDEARPRRRAKLEQTRWHLGEENHETVRCQEETLDTGCARSTALRRSQWSRGLKDKLSWRAQALRSWVPTPLEARHDSVRLFCAFLELCERQRPCKWLISGSGGGLGVFPKRPIMHVPIHRLQTELTVDVGHSLLQAPQSRVEHPHQNGDGSEPWNYSSFGKAQF
jgi:hypothetical protein